MQQVFEFYFDGTFCKTPETRHNVFHIVWLLPFGFLLKIKIMMEQIFILVWVQHHTSHSLTKLLHLNAHVTFCLISFHLHILLTYYVAIHYVWIQLCRELITCFNVYVDVCCVAFLYIWLPFVCLFFCLFVLCRPTLFSFQFHVIAIVTLACTLLSHHWSMLAGRYNLIGNLWERRKCVHSSLSVDRLLHSAHSSSQQSELFCCKSCHQPDYKHQIVQKHIRWFQNVECYRFKYYLITWIRVKIFWLYILADCTNCVKLPKDFWATSLYKRFYWPSTLSTTNVETH